MKRKDLVVGQEYASSRQKDWEQWPYFVTRVKVLVAGEATHVLVIPVDEEGAQPRLMATRDIKQPWSEYEIAQAAREKRARENELAAFQRRIEIEQKQAEAQRTLNEIVPDSALLPFWVRKSAYGGRGQMNVIKLAEIVSAAYDAGQRSITEKM